MTSMLTPILMLQMGANIALTYIVSGLVTSFFIWYSGWRIISTLNLLKSKVSHMNKGDDKADILHDELYAALQWSDMLVSDLESERNKIVNGGKNKKVIPEVEPSVIKAKFSSGPPVQGELMLHHSDNIGHEFFIDISLEKNMTYFESALDRSRQTLKDMSLYLSEDEKKSGIVDFQLFFLEDKNFLEGMNRSLGEGRPFDVALEDVFKIFKKRLLKKGSQYFKDRVSDLMDIKNMLKKNFLLDAREVKSDQKFLAGKIVYCEQVYPSDVIRLHQMGVKGLIVLDGTSSSHAQILLDSFDLSSVSGLVEDVEVKDGLKVVVNTVHKKVVFNPSGDDLKSLNKITLQLQEQKIIHEEISINQSEVVHVEATINMATSADKAKSFGADGIGLFRSEFAYMGRYELPGEDELTHSYREMTQCFTDKHVVLRLLDVGGDKLSWFQSQKNEENPSMGSRSMRFLLKHQEIFRTQMRAIFKSAHDQTFAIFPMVSSLDEVEKIDEKVSDFKRELIEEGEELAPLKFGIMVEVPSIVEKLEDYMQRYDYFSLGTNDLVQYTLAVDRNNREVSDYYSSCHPSILSMVHRVIQTGLEFKKEVGLCGQSASDFKLMPLWIGLGLRRFSIPYQLIPTFKSRLLQLPFDECRLLSADVLESHTIHDVRKKLNTFEADLKIA